MSYFILIDTISTGFMVSLYYMIFGYCLDYIRIVINKSSVVFRYFLVLSLKIKILKSKNIYICVYMCMYTCVYSTYKLIIT